MADRKTTIHVKASEIPEVREALEAAAALAGGVRSFLSSLPFQPPEAIGFQAQVKLVEPLAAYDAALHGKGRS